MEFLKISFFSLIFGFLLDLFIGDPHWLPHPVQLIGWLINRLEHVLRKLFPKTSRGEFIAGTILVIITLLASIAVPALLLWLGWSVHPVLYFILESIMCYQILAVTSLKRESMKVYQQLKLGNLDKAKAAVSMIVGRDVKPLDESGVTRAAVETVAENASDGVVAPLLFLAIGGAPFGFFYKAVNTLDSMVGYKNDKYLYFGHVAAKFDDIMNFIPARICAWLMIFSSFLLKFDSKQAKKIYLRDRFNHASPNSAQTESVCAGALHIQLAGDAYYFGKLCAKPFIGDDDRCICAEDIVRVNRIMFVAAVVAFLLALCLRGIVLWMDTIF